MRLVTIPNKEVSDFLYQIINNANKITRYWTSGTSLIDGKNWVWFSTLKQIIYTNWLFGQPDLPAERCIELQLQKSRGLQWNNLDCNIQLNFICESQDVNDKGEVMPNNWQGAFADPSISPNFPVLNYNKNSYYIGNHMVLSYVDADRFCKLIGMELVSIESKEENNYIYNYIRDTIAGTTFWSAGTRLVNGIDWYWLPYGRKVTYTNWFVGKPDSKVEHCIQLQFLKDSGLFWNDLNCAIAQNFICEAPTEKIAACPIIDPACEKLPANQCPTISKSPAFHFGKEKVTNNDAVKKCNDLGLKLISIRDKATQEYVQKYIANIAYDNPFWTSGNRLSDQTTWRWLSGENIKEFFWNTGEPNNSGGEECISIKKEGQVYGWNDAPCNQLNYYICEYPYEHNNCQNSCNQLPVVNVFIDNEPKTVY
ncbi:unnamed protein product [Psylliodes chrysocephalus]|uniref:C-type lectin domain-containing protein n=1 Tax=Psylliodes chrysocephalus TaxID=3402493 RepID=A0A9P0CWV7_9CUCU|nr:unnamed protein product [Psylliodes chrysocephala]